MNSPGKVNGRKTSSLEQNRQSTLRNCENGPLQLYWVKAQHLWVATRIMTVIVVYGQLLVPNKSAAHTVTNAALKCWSGGNNTKWSACWFTVVVLTGVNSGMNTAIFLQQFAQQSLIRANNTSEGEGNLNTNFYQTRNWWSGSQVRWMDIFRRADMSDESWPNFRSIALSGEHPSRKLMQMVEDE